MLVLHLALFLRSEFLNRNIVIFQNGPKRAALPAPEPSRDNGSDSEPLALAEARSTSVLPSQGKRLPALVPARAPRIKWSQDLFILSLEITPGVNIEDYYLRWTANRIQFR